MMINKDSLRTKFSRSIPIRGDVDREFKITGGSLVGIEGKGNGRKISEESMDALIEQLDAKLRCWQSETAEQVRQRIAEIIELADQNALAAS